MEPLPILMGLTASPALETHKNPDDLKREIMILSNNLNSTYSYYTLENLVRNNSSKL